MVRFSYLGGCAPWELFNGMERSKKSLTKERPFITMEANNRDIFKEGVMSKANHSYH